MFLEHTVARYYLHQPGIEATLLDYQGKQVLLHHSPGDPKGVYPSTAPPLVAVVGYVVGEFQRQRKEGVPITEVEIIMDFIERKEITRLLRAQGEKKPINFWDEEGQGG